MKTIVRRSAAIVTFLSLIGVALHAAQLRHLQRFADLLVTAPRRKTLGQLATLELDGVDAVALAEARGHVEENRRNRDAPAPMVT